MAMPEPARPTSAGMSWHQFPSCIICIVHLRRILLTSGCFLPRALCVLTTQIKAMDQSIVARQPQHDSSSQLSGLERLHPDIRYEIYHYLFHDLHSPFEVDVSVTDISGKRYDDFGPGTSSRIRHSTHLERKGLCHGGIAKGTQTQLDNAMSLTATCRTTRDEVMPIVYSKVVLAWTSRMSFLTFTSRLTPFTAQQLRHVTLPDDDMPPSTAYKNSICTALAGLTGLQDVSVRFRRFADPRTKGTEWRPYHLRWLKQLCANLPQLRHIHDFVRRDEYTSYYGFRLSTDNVTRLDEFGSIDVDAEYQLWLDANKQQRISKRAEWISEQAERDAKESRQA